MERKQLNWLILIVIILAIIFDASGDAAMDIGKKIEGHIISSLSIMFLLLLIIVEKEMTIREFIWLVVGFILIRFGIFDLTYNLTAGLPWYFIGSTSIYDKIMALWGGKALLLARIIALAGGIHMIIKKV